MQAPTPNHVRGLADVLTPRQMIVITRNRSSAGSHVGESGWRHGDVKPGNVIAGTVGPR